MKTIILAAILFSFSCATHAEDSIDKKLQRALFAEEGTRDLDKAIEAYQAVIADYDTQRKFAATAIFRLAECHRKKEQKEPAIATYRRLLKEFPEEETLARLAKENLAALGAPLGDVQSEAATASESEAAEIARIKKLVELSPDLLNDPTTCLLHRAAKKSQRQVAAFLIDSGADPNLEAKGSPIVKKECEIFTTPLADAASSGHLAMVSFLLDRGAKMDESVFINAVANHAHRRQPHRHPAHQTRHRPDQNRPPRRLQTGGRLARYIHKNSGAQFTTP